MKQYRQRERTHAPNTDPIMAPEMFPAERVLARLVVFAAARGPCKLDDGREEGSLVGCDDGVYLMEGLDVGWDVGCPVGFVGRLVGWTEGCDVSRLVGCLVGCAVG